MSIRTIGTFTAGALLASALTFTGMQSWQAGAAPGDSDTTFVPVAPCRLINTRPDADNVGARIAPLGPGETFTTQVTGSNGDCIGIPSDATAVALNVTIADPTGGSFLTLYPADLATRPDASNLNWIAAQPPTPNKVDVKLSPDGKVKIYNHASTVNIITDIVGYYTPSSLQSLQAQLHTLTTQVDTLRKNKPIIAQSNNAIVEASLTGEFREISSLGFNAPALGKVYVHAQGSAVDFDAGEDVHCTIGTQAPTTTASAYWPRWEAAGPTPGNPAGEGDSGVMAVSRVFSVDAGQNAFRFYCKNTSISGTSELWGPQMFAIYVPD